MKNDRGISQDNLVDPENPEKSSTGYFKVPKSVVASIALFILAVAAVVLFVYVKRSQESNLVEGGASGIGHNNTSTTILDSFKEHQTKPPFQKHTKGPTEMFDPTRRPFPIEEKDDKDKEIDTEDSDDGDLDDEDSDDD